jgi:hypothetical protein
VPNCERCGKYISGLEAKRYNNYCYKCYCKWLREWTPFFIFAGRAGKKGVRIPIPHLAFLKKPFKKRRIKNEETKGFLTCNICGYFPLNIDSISKDTYSDEYRVITKCSKCKDFEINHVPKEVFDKLDLENM